MNMIDIANKEGLVEDFKKSMVELQSIVHATRQNMGIKARDIELMQM